MSSMPIVRTWVRILPRTPPPISCATTSRSRANPFAAHFMAGVLEPMEPATIYPIPISFPRPPGCGPILWWSVPGFSGFGTTRKVSSRIIRFPTSVATSASRAGSSGRSTSWATLMCMASRLSTTWRTSAISCLFTAPRTGSISPTSSRITSFINITAPDTGR